MRQETKNNFSILFVDDEEISTKYFKKFFEQDFNVYVAHSATEALEILSEKSNEIAIIISDQRMPKSTGVQFLIEAREKYPNIVRILTTAYSDLTDNIAAINESHIFGYLTKPWQIEEVRTVLYNALSEFKTRVALLSLGGSIAHEVRNPLGAINLSLHQIEDCINHKQQDGSVKLKEEDVFRAQGMIDDAYTSIRRANQIINFILNDLKGRKPNKKDFAYLSTESIINKAVKEYGYSHSNQKNKMVVGDIEDFIFRGDETLAIYILFNLIKNALHALKGNPQGTINISSKRNVDGFNVIYVTDNGTGIPSDKLESVFNSFFTLGKENGTGLGLSFCKRTMETFDGTISCTSELHQYTTFTLSFPILDEDELIKAKSKMDSPEYTSSQSPIKRILVIDDQKTNLITTKTIIDNHLSNIYCDLMLDGKEAIEHVKHNKYDMVLLDLQMPKIDGFNVSKEIRRFDKEIPIIAYTSLTQAEIESLNQDHSNIDYYLAKSSSHDMLLKTVSKWTLSDYRNDEEPLSKSDLKVILKGCKILIADDERINRVLLSKMLSKDYGAIVDQVENGQELFDKYIEQLESKEPYIAILTDIYMPIMRGDEVSKKIKDYQKEHNIKAPVYTIAISGDGDKEKVHGFLKAGMDDYFVKGDNYDKLAKIIGFWINSKNYNQKQIDSALRSKKVSGNSYRKLSFENLAEVGAMFIKDGENLIGKIKSAFKNNNSHDFQFHVHALKGISGNVGAKEIYELCSKIELDAKSNKFPKDEIWVKDLEEKFAETKKRITNLYN
jgi:two-component system, CAI-1 autoinducer sensor kinase/phosphatase CqsS